LFSPEQLRPDQRSRDRELPSIPIAGRKDTGRNRHCRGAYCRWSCVCSAHCQSNHISSRGRCSSHPRWLGKPLRVGKLSAILWTRSFCGAQRDYDINVSCVVRWISGKRCSCFGIFFGTDL